MGTSGWIDACSNRANAGNWEQRRKCLICHSFHRGTKKELKDDQLASRFDGISQPCSKYRANNAFCRGIKSHKQYWSKTHNSQVSAILQSVPSTTRFGDAAAAFPYAADTSWGESALGGAAAFSAGGFIRLAKACSSSSSSFWRSASLDSTAAFSCTFGQRSGSTGSRRT